MKMNFELPKNERLEKGKEKRSQISEKLKSLITKGAIYLAAYLITFPSCSPTYYGNTPTRRTCGEYSPSTNDKKYHTKYLTPKQLKKEQEKKKKRIAEQKKAKAKALAKKNKSQY